MQRLYSNRHKAMLSSCRSNAVVHAPAVHHPSVFVALSLMAFWTRNTKALLESTMEGPFKPYHCEPFRNLLLGATPYLITTRPLQPCCRIAICKPCHIGPNQGPVKPCHRDAPVVIFGGFRGRRGPSRRGPSRRSVCYRGPFVEVAVESSY